MSALIPAGHAARRKKANLDIQATPETPQGIARLFRRTPTNLGHEWPRPQLVHDHTALFREPVYTDDQPYADDDDDLEDGEQN